MRDTTSNQARRYRAVVVTVLGLVAVSLHPDVSFWDLDVFMRIRRLCTDHVAGYPDYSFYNFSLGVQWVSGLLLVA